MAKIFHFFDSLALRIQRTALVYRTQLYRTFKQHHFDITPEQWVILNVLSKQNGLSQTEIADITLKDKTLITRMLDALERKQYIERKKDTTDRRCYRIVLTEAGRNLLIPLNTLAQENLAMSLDGIEKAKLAIVKDVLEQIENNLR